jgi:hypothetical protein
LCVELVELQIEVRAVEDKMQVVDLNGILVLTPMVPMVPELAREIERARLGAGLSIEELLAGLREQRERYYTEKFAGAVNDAKSGTSNIRGDGC